MKALKKVFENLYFDFNLLRVPVGFGVFAIKLVAEVERRTDDRFEA